MKKQKQRTEAVKDEKTKSSIDIHIVGKIDLETVARETKATKKEEKEKPKPETSRERRCSEGGKEKSGCKKQKNPLKKQQQKP